MIFPQYNNLLCNVEKKNDEMPYRRHRTVQIRHKCGIIDFFDIFDVKRDFILTTMKISLYQLYWIYL